jgi:antirestriction protein ArdC
MAKPRKSRTSKTPVVKADPYQRVTDLVIRALEQGTPVWRKPWQGGSAPVLAAPRRHEGTPYQGINVLILWIEAEIRGFTNNVWMTYKQAESYGAHVRKGETSTKVVKALKFQPDDKTTGKPAVDKDGKPLLISTLKEYSVFNVEQIDGLPGRFYKKAEPVKPVAQIQFERIARAETYFSKINIRCVEGGNTASFSPSRNLVSLPKFEQFKSAESYYSTKGHEYIHATGHETRLKREFGQRFGDNSYAFEELVAELGTTFLCTDLELPINIREDHASYLAHWLQILKADKRAIFTAATKAKEAVLFLHKEAQFSVKTDETVEETAEEETVTAARAA